MHFFFFFTPVNSTPVSILEENSKLERALFISLALTLITPLPTPLPMMLSSISMVDMWTTFISTTWKRERALEHPPSPGFWEVEFENPHFNKFLSSRRFRRALKTGLSHELTSSISGVSPQAGPVRNLWAPRSMPVDSAYWTGHVDGTYSCLLRSHAVRPQSPLHGACGEI